VTCLAVCDVITKTVFIWIGVREVISCIPLIICMLCLAHQTMFQHFIELRDEFVGLPEVFWFTLVPCATEHKNVLLGLNPRMVLVMLRLIQSSWVCANICRRQNNRVLVAASPISEYENAH
jgi:hypothetical protein